MRMTRVNITVPDELVLRARNAGLNVSAVASAALAEELDRRDKIAELDAYLAELETAHGPIPLSDRDEARRWADQAFAASAATRSA